MRRANDFSSPERAVQSRPLETLLLETLLVARVGSRSSEIWVLSVCIGKTAAFALKLRVLTRRVPAWSGVSSIRLRLGSLTNLGLWWGAWSRCSLWTHAHHLDLLLRFRRVLPWCVLARSVLTRVRLLRRVLARSVLARVGLLRRVLARVGLLRRVLARAVLTRVGLLRRTLPRAVLARV